MSSSTEMYKKGSLAALRAERASKKLQADNKNNVLMPSASTSSISDNGTDEYASAQVDDCEPHLELEHHNHNGNNHAHASADNHDDDTNATQNNANSAAYIDAHGFLVSEDEKQKKMAEIGSNSHRSTIRKQNERIYKWLQMLDEWDVYTTTKKAKLKSRIRKGIPAPLRAKVWKHILGVNELTKQQRLYYAKLRHQSPAQKFKHSIDNDLDRTFPRHILFKRAEQENHQHSNHDNNNNDDTIQRTGRGKESLRNVLYAYANHDTDVGYTQGMGFIVALLLMLMTEDDAFWCLVKLLDQNGAFAMRGLYIDGLPMLHMRYHQLDHLLHKFMPKVHAHINDTLQIAPPLYTSKWFITVFCYELPFDFVYRIWDIYLYEGIKFVFRVALALIKINESQILRIREFEQGMKFLQNIHEHVESIDALLAKAFDLGLKHEHLEVAEEQYNRKKLQEQREANRTAGRRGRRGREVSDLDPPDFVKRLSVNTAENNCNGNRSGSFPFDGHDELSITPRSADAATAAAEDEEAAAAAEQDLNDMYKAKPMASISHTKSDTEPQQQQPPQQPQHASMNEVEEEEKCDGSHSDSSYVDEEPSSAVPNKHAHNHGHEPLEPTGYDAIPSQTTAIQGNISEAVENNHTNHG